MFFTRYPLLAIIIVSGMLLFNSTALQAADDSKEIHQQLLELQQQMQRQQQDHQTQIDALEKRLDKTPKLFASTTNTANSSSPLQIGLSGLFAAGGSSVDNAALANLQAGGHDPNKNGFTVQNVELSIGATVDPYLDAQTNFIFLINAAGETVVELEEAFFISRSLPGGCKLKAASISLSLGDKINNILIPGPSLTSPSCSPGSLVAMACAARGYVHPG